MQRATWSQTKEPRRVSKPDYLGLVVKEGFLEEGTWLMNSYQSSEGVVWMHLPCRGRACIGRFWDSDRLGRGPLGLSRSCVCRVSTLFKLRLCVYLGQPGRWLMEIVALSPPMLRATIKPGLADSSCKGSESKYFWLCVSLSQLLNSASIVCI